MPAPRKVAMFCGNIFVGGEALESELAQPMREIIGREEVGVAYGALAAGSDILIAELLLRHGAELHVVLPFAEPDFLAQSVAPAGASWVDRYHAIMARASSLTVLSTRAYRGDTSLFAHGSTVSMGMARQRARDLKSEAIQLAIVEPRGADTLSGSDIRTWQAIGGRAEVVTAPPLVRPAMPPPPTSDAPQGIYSLMFAEGAEGADASDRDGRDVSRIWHEVTARAARMPDATAASGSLFAMFDDAVTAAAAALDLSEALATHDGPGLRIVLHPGALHPQPEPLKRIEAPPGAVYVTEPFAAVLEMTPENPFVCTPDGQIALPWDYGVFPLYRLVRRATRT